MNNNYINYITYNNPDLYIITVSNILVFIQKLTTKISYMLENFYSRQAISLDGGTTT
jgi:hypothetical protein